MTNSGGYNNIDDTVAEAQENGANDVDDKAVTESGEISTDTNTDEIFSDSVPGDESSAAGDSESSENGDDDEDDNDISVDDKESAID